MYIMHRDGVPEGDKKRLYQHARLALHEMDAVDNLAYLGVNVSKVSFLCRPFFSFSLIAHPSACRIRARSASRCSSSDRKRMPTTFLVSSHRSSTCLK